MYDAASCEKRGDVAEVPPQRLRRMVIRRGRCMTRRRFVGHAMQELVSAASPKVAMINGMMSGAGVPSYMTSGADVLLSMTAGVGGERTRLSCSAKNILRSNVRNGCQAQAVNRSRKAVSPDVLLMLLAVSCNGSQVVGIVLVSDVILTV